MHKKAFWRGTFGFRRHFHPLSKRSCQSHLGGEKLECRWLLAASPTLDMSASPVIELVQENASVPAVGDTTGSTRVADLIDASGPLSNYADDDGDLPGIAITGVNLQGGRLWYTTDAGASWSEITAAHHFSATLLYADSDTRLYFAPADGFTGSISDVLSFRAWDRTGGFENGTTGVNTQLADPYVLPRPFLVAAEDMVISSDGRYALLTTDGFGLQVYDVLTDTTQPVRVGGFEEADTPLGNLGVEISADGRYAYVVDGPSGLHIIDVQDPASPQFLTRVGGVLTAGDALDVELSPDGRYAYVTHSDGLSIIDVQAPENPVLVGNTSHIHARSSGRVVISPDGQYAFIRRPVYTVYSESLAVFDVGTPTAPALAYRMRAGVPTYEVAFSQDGLYAYTLGPDGLAIYDVHSDPVNPLRVGKLAPNTKERFYKRIAVSPDGATVYLGGGDNRGGLLVVDVRNPTSPVPTGRYVCPFLSFDPPLAVSPDGRYAYLGGEAIIDLQTQPVYAPSFGELNTLGYAHDVAVSTDGRYAYVAGDAEGLQVIDVQTYTNPLHIGSVNTIGRVTGVSLSVDNRYAYVATSDRGLKILDLQNKEAPSLVGSFDTGGGLSGITLSRDGKYAYTAHGHSGLKIINIEDPANPTPIGVFETSGAATKVAISPDGNLAYVASGLGGLQIIDVQDPQNPFRVGEYYSDGNFCDVAVTPDGRYVFVARGSKGFEKIDVHDPAVPFSAFSGSLYGSFYGVTVSIDGSSFYLNGEQHGQSIFRGAVTSPSEGSRVFYGGLSTKSGGIALSHDEEFAYAACGSAGIRIIALKQPKELRNRTIDFHALEQANDVTVSADGRVYVADSRDVDGLKTYEVQADSTLRDIVGTNGINYPRNLALSADRRHAFIIDLHGLVVFDVQDPVAPVKIAELETSRFSWARNLRLSSNGRFALIADSNNGMQIIDVSDPSKPTNLGEFYTEHSSALDVAISLDDRYAYILNSSSDGLQVVDLLNPHTPAYVGKVDVNGGSMTFSPDGRYAYVTNGQNVIVVDFQNPRNPVPVGSFDTADSALRVAISADGQFAYVAASYSGLQIFDVQEPTNATLVSIFDTNGRAEGVTLSANGQVAYIADDFYGLKVVDIKDPASPRFVGGILFGQGANADVAQLTADGRYVYVVDYFNGVHIVDVSTNPASPIRVAGFEERHNVSPSAVAVSTDGRYAYVGDHSNGLKILDVQAVPSTHPLRVGGVNLPGYVSDVSLSFDGKRAYVAAGDGGLQVVNVEDPVGARIMGEFNALGLARNVAVSPDGKYAYLANDSADMYVIDVSDPRNPSRKGVYNSKGRAEDVTVSADGRYAYVANGADGLHIVDVGTDPTHPTLVGRFDTTGRAGGVALSANTRYAYIADGNAGLKIVDVRDPANPSRVGMLDTSGFAHRVRVSQDGQFVYIADRSGGLQIVDVRIPSSPAAVATVEMPGNVEGVALSRDGRYAYILDGRRLRVVDVTNPVAPTLVSDTAFTFDGSDVALADDGRYLYVTRKGWTNPGLLVIDVQDPANPIAAGHFVTPGMAYGVTVSPGGQFAYVADGKSGLQIVDVQDPMVPYGAGAFSNGVSDARAIELSSNERYAFVAAAHGGLQIVDVQLDPENPTLTGAVDTGGAICDVKLSSDGRYAFAVGVDRGDVNNMYLYVIDVQQPTQPTVIGEIHMRETGETSNESWGLAISPDDRYAYVSGQLGMRVIDVKTDPTNPTLVALLKVSARGRVALSADGRTAYVASRHSGLLAVDVELGLPSFSQLTDVVRLVGDNDILLTSSLIPENQPSGTLVGTLTPSDLNAGTAFTYSLVAGDGDEGNYLFEIVDDRLLSLQPFDYESRSNYAIRVLMSGADGSSYEKAFVVQITNESEVPTIDSLSDVFISGNSAEQIVSLTGITAGGGESQRLRVTAVSSDSTILADPSVTYTSPDAIGSLSFAPVAGSTGAVTITVTIEDGGFDDDLSTGDDNGFTTESFLVTVTAGQPSVKPESVLTFASNGLWLLNASNGSSLTQTTYASWAVNDRIDWTSVVKGDFNGDGLMDVAGRTNIGQWWASLNNGNGTGGNGRGGTAPVLMTYWRPALDIQHVVAGDFNGDGYTDVAGLAGSGAWWVGFANADGDVGFTNVRVGGWLSSFTFASVQIGDFNGDGKSDIAGLASSGQWFGLIGQEGRGWESLLLGFWNPALNFSADIVAADFNGDGRTDIAGRTASNFWYVATAKPDALGFNTELLGVWGATTWSTPTVGDFNGDGQADILARAANGQWWGLVSDGSSGLRTNTLVGYWNPNVVWTGVIAGDADGDGRDELLGRRATSLATARGALWIADVTEGLMKAKRWGFQGIQESVEARNLFFSNF